MNGKLYLNGEEIAVVTKIEFPKRLFGGYFEKGAWIKSVWEELAERGVNFYLDQSKMSFTITFEDKGHFEKGRWISDLEPIFKMLNG